jgi:excisionase family DNA binding protein
MERLTYTVDEVAEILGLSRSKTYDLVACGEIPVVPIAGRRKLIARLAVQRLLDAGPLVVERDESHQRRAVQSGYADGRLAIPLAINRDATGGCQRSQRTKGPAQRYCAAPRCTRRIARKGLRSRVRRFESCRGRTSKSALTSAESLVRAISGVTATTRD